LRDFIKRNFCPGRVQDKILKNKPGTDRIRTSRSGVFIKFNLQKIFSLSFLYIFPAKKKIPKEFSKKKIFFQQFYPRKRFFKSFNHSSISNGEKILHKIRQNLRKAKNEGIELSKIFGGFPDFQALEF